MASANDCFDVIDLASAIQSLPEKDEVILQYRAEMLLR